MNTGRAGQTCPGIASSAAGRGPRPRASAPPRTEFFLKLMLCRAKNRHTALRLPAILRLRIATTISSSVRSGLLAICASRNFACFSSGEVLPPLGFAATLPGLLKPLHPNHHHARAAHVWALRHRAIGR